MLTKTLTVALCVCLGLAAIGQASSFGERSEDKYSESQQQGGLGAILSGGLGGSSSSGTSSSSGGSGSEYQSTGQEEGSKYSSSEADFASYKGAPKLPQQEEEHKVETSTEGKGKHEGSATPVPSYPAADKNKQKPGDAPMMFDLSQLAQQIFSPFELVRKIADIFKISQEKLVEKLGKGLVFGAEALLTPVVASLKIIEKIFVPDACRMKLLCQIGNKFGFVKDTVTKFSPNLLRGSAHTKALTEGISGQNCDHIFKECGEPKLKKPYDELTKSTSSSSIL